MLLRYVINCKYRLGPMSLFLMALISVLLGTSLAFKDSLFKASSIDNSYSSVAYQFGYELNYSCGSPFEIIYPDTDIQLYTTASKDRRIVSSVLMETKNGLKEKVSQFDFNILEHSDQIIIPENISKSYGLKIGDIIFCEYPFSLRLFEIRVIDICPAAYDFSENSIRNDVGLVCIGFNENYLDTSNCKYVLLTKESEAGMLSDFPQILRRTFTSHHFIAQGRLFLIEPFAVTSMLIVGLYMLYFFTIGSITLADLKRLHKLGLRVWKIRLFSFCEFVMLFVAPIVIVTLAVQLSWLLFSPIYLLGIAALIALVLLFEAGFIIRRTRGGAVHETARN